MTMLDRHSMTDMTAMAPELMVMDDFFCILIAD